MSAVYDYTASPQNDPMVLILNNLMRAEAISVSPNVVFLVKAFPFCKRLVK